MHSVLLSSRVIDNFEHTNVVVFSLRVVDATADGVIQKRLWWEEYRCKTPRIKIVCEVDGTRFARTGAIM